MDKIKEIYAVLKIDRSDTDNIEITFLKYFENMRKAQNYVNEIDKADKEKQFEYRISKWNLN